MKVRLVKKVAIDWHKVYKKDKFEIQVKPLTPVESLSIRPHISFINDARVVFDTIGIEKIITYGLLDWRNLYTDDKNPQEIPFTLDNALSLPPDHLDAICELIIIASNLSEEDKKK